MTYEDAMKKAREGHAVHLPGMVEHWNVVYELGQYWLKSKLTEALIAYRPETHNDQDRHDWKLID